MEQKLIITEPSFRLRERGRTALAGRWKKTVTALLIYYICLQMPVIMLDSLFGRMRYIGGEAVHVGSGLSFLYILLVTGSFSFGLMLYFLDMFRKKDAQPSQIFSGFEIYGRTLSLGLLMMLFITLWTMLFIVPGIIAAIRYSQAFFILADDPHKSAMQCIEESKQMMWGNKEKYFCMIISFIGWIILAMIPAMIFSGIVQITGYSNYFIVQTVTLTCSLGMLWVYSYIYSTAAGFYEILKGNSEGETYTPGEY